MQEARASVRHVAATNGIAKPSLLPIRAGVERQRRERGSCARIQIGREPIYDILRAADLASESAIRLVLVDLLARMIGARAIADRILLVVAVRTGAIALEPLDGLDHIGIRHGGRRRQSPPLDRLGTGADEHRRP